jgi:hypothetical protein
MISYLINSKKYLQKGNIDEAILTLYKAIDTNPNFSWYYYQLGESFVRKECYSEAAFSYLKAINLNSNCAFFYWRLGEILTLWENHDPEAIAFYYRALQLKPHCSLFRKLILHPSREEILTDSTNDRLFTVQLGAGSGLGAQLLQFEFLYLFGRLLSYKYVHQNFACPRSSLKLPDFLGLEKFESHLSNLNSSDQQIIEVNVDDRFIFDHQRKDIDSIKNYFNGLHDLDQKIIKFKFMSWNHCKLIKKIVYDQSKIKNVFQSEVNLPLKYWNQRNIFPVDSHFKQNKIKIAIHIRKGDTAVVQINQELISCWQVKIQPNLLHLISVDRINSIDDAWAKHIDINDYYIILKNLFDHFGKENFSIVLISDGYQKSFERIREAAQKLNLNLEDINQAEDLYKSGFDIFSRHSNIYCIIGEEESKLFESIHAVICADVIIYGHGSFVPSIVKYLRPDNDKPIMVSLLNSIDHKQFILRLKSQFKNKFLNSVNMMTPVRSTCSNISLNKLAQQSSLSQWSKSNDAQGAVNGIKNGKFGFSTDRQENPWWQVDLGSLYYLTEVRVFNRIETQSVAERAWTLIILLSHDSKNWTQVYDNQENLIPFGGIDGYPLIVNLDSQVARYVRLQLQETNYLHLDEVEIFGTQTIDF